jgi:protein-tyrosine phosphatase
VIDLHCHILPGLDDGPSTIEEALDMCRIAVEDGIQAIVATPHMLNGMFLVDRGDVLQGVGAMSRALSEASIPLQILPGADVHLDQSVPGCLERGELITVADRGRHLLLEFPQDIVPEGTGELLFQVQLKGITPIITHPERNIAIQQNPAILNDLVRTGSLTQITAGSLTGIFGARVRRCTLRLLRSGTAHLVSTDAHNTGRRSPRLSEAREAVEKELGREEAERIFVERPTKILQGTHVEVPEPLTDPDGPTRRRSFWKRLFSYF